MDSHGGFCSPLTVIPRLFTIPGHLSHQPHVRKDSERKVPNHRNHNLLGEHYHFPLFHSLEASIIPALYVKERDGRGMRIRDRGQGTLNSCGHQIHLLWHFFIFCLIEWTPSVLSPLSSLQLPLSPHKGHQLFHVIALQVTDLRPNLCPTTPLLISFNLDVP